MSPGTTVFVGVIVTVDYNNNKEVILPALDSNYRTLMFGWRIYRICLLLRDILLVSSKNIFNEQKNVHEMNEHLEPSFYSFNVIHI